MKPVAFEYCRPETVPEAAALLAELGDRGRLLAGGMSLGPMLNMRLVRPDAVVDLMRLDALKAVQIGEETVSTGAMLSQAAAFSNSELMRAVPLLALALPHVGHRQTRNRGTLGGSVAHGDPSAEIPLALVTLDGSVVLHSHARERCVRARDFFQGALATACRPDELVSRLDWPRQRTGEVYAFEEVAERHGDFAIAAVACRLVLAGDGTIDALSLGLGGIEDRPLALPTDDYLGSPSTEGTAVDLAEAAAARVQPIADPIAGADYRRHLTRLLVRHALERAFGQARRTP
ncbi:MAG: FAD binding domain-containing protein [Alphaproteobacteria bacterium]|nr:FAD binding domain-containing protein [Alphaproteobacteria bacterium]